MQRVLIVDDNETNLYFLEVLLKGNGYLPIRAANGAEALAEALKSPPDLIISDILMPVMDGYALCRQWRADERLKHIPFIFYTATFIEEKDEKLALAVGADRFLIKPQEPETLMKIIREVMTETGKIREAPEAGLTADDAKVLEDYNEALFRKLEKKMADLEDTNAQLNKKIAEEELLQEELRSSSEKYLRLANRYSKLIKAIPDGIGIFNSEMHLLMSNASPACWAARGFAGSGEEAVLKCSMQDRVNPSPCAAVCPAIKTFKTSRNEQSTFDLANDTWELRAFPFNDSENEKVVLCIARDLTKHRKLEEQLRQAQKIESLGRLAGGVAHDLNNMLGVVIGYADMAKVKLEASSPLQSEMDEIIKAASRSVNITRQLLAFARKQKISPKVIDLNEAISEMLTMLQRLVGENIKISWRQGSSPWCVNIDPAQIDQILANLCVNSKDAIPDTGMISIETDRASIDEELCPSLTDVSPGEYVVLTVSDDGCGMDKATLENIFEPFFTTKAPGRGTGLGLATVYGIVKQNSGFIHVYSEPGLGTTFKIYLPRHADASPKTAMEAPKPIPRGNGETVLVVEDENTILDLTNKQLVSIGYKVLSAENPVDALEVAEKNKDEITLLLTDVIMPDMNGRELAKRISAIIPAAKCIFMSGYAEDIISSKGIIHEGVNFIQKPFSVRELAIKISEVIKGEV